MSKFSHTKSREGSIESSKISYINSDIAILKSNFTKLRSKITSNNNGTGIEEMVPKLEASSIVYNDIDSQGLSPKANDALDILDISMIK
jgi:hypothetical protein